MTATYARFIPATAAVLALLAAAGAHAQVVPLFSKSGLTPDDPGISTGTLTQGAAIPAPAGASWSETAGTNTDTARALAGVAAQPAITPGAFRVADSFVVPAGKRWIMSNFAYFGYQPGSTLAPFYGASTRLWRGRPGDVGSQVIWDSASQQTFTRVLPTSVYRIFSTLAEGVGVEPDTSRRLWRVEHVINANGPSVWLEPGQYYLDWQLLPTNAEAEAFIPTFVRNVTQSAASFDQAALQLRPGVPQATWNIVLDLGQTPLSTIPSVNLPFQIVGTEVRRCIGDFPSPGQPPSGVITIDSVFNYLSAWFTQSPRADANLDGLVTIDDIFEFLSAWFQGC